MSNHAPYLDRTGKAGRDDIKHPRLVHNAYGQGKKENQVQRSHEAQVYRLMSHIAVLEREIKQRPDDTRRKLRYQSAVAKLTMHLVAMPKGTVLRG